MHPIHSHRQKQTDAYVLNTAAQGGGDEEEENAAVKAPKGNHVFHLATAECQNTRVIAEI